MRVMTDGGATIRPDSNVDLANPAKCAAFVPHQASSIASSWIVVATQQMSAWPDMATKRQCGLFPDGHPRGNRSTVR